MIAKLREASTEQLKAKRHQLAQSLVHPDAMLRGSLVNQGRRCGKTTCKCQRNELHGPYTYLTVGRKSGESSLVYVSAALVDTVKHHIEESIVIDTVLAEISAINVELLKRGELD